MRLVFLYGPHVVSKLSVARELAARTGFKLLHNHLTIDLVASVFPFGSAQYKRLITRFRRDLIAESAREGVDLIFTFVYSALPGRRQAHSRPQQVTQALDLRVLDTVAGSHAVSRWWWFRALARPLGDRHERTTAGRCRRRSSGCPWRAGRRPLPRRARLAIFSLEQADRSRVRARACLPPDVTLRAVIRIGGTWTQPLGKADARRVRDVYGDDAARLVRENPYRLADDIHGIGFVTADSLRVMLGIGPTSPFRIHAALKYVLSLVAALRCMSPPSPRATTPALRLARQATRQRTMPATMPASCTPTSAWPQLAWRGCLPSRHRSSSLKSWIVRSSVPRRPTRSRAGVPLFVQLPVPPKY
jgi:Helix-hairpin-helix containing domain